MSTAAERLANLASMMPSGDSDRETIEEVLAELGGRRDAETEQREMRTIAARQGYSPISIYNDLLIPPATLLTRHAEVRFQTGLGPRDYIEATMPTTRDQGWVQISTGDFFNTPTIQLRSGLLMLRAETKQS